MFWSDHTVFLNILTFGVFHYYGYLLFNRERIDLEVVLTPRQAAKLNQLDGHRTGEYLQWSVGDTTSRVEKKATLISVAKAQWKTNFPSALILMRGSSSTAQPQEILALDGLPKERTENLHELWLQFEEHVYSVGPQGLWNNHTADLNNKWKAELKLYLGENRGE